MEMGRYLWTILLALIITIDAYHSPNISSTFIPEDHPNWKKLDHSNCGFSTRNRIIGGTAAHLGQYPWLIRMGKYISEKDGDFIIFVCGGAVLNKYYIITAAHCFLKRSIFPNMARIGEFDATTNPDCFQDSCAEPVQDIDLVECYVPHDFKPKLMENDIALCLMARPIKFSETVAPICLQPSTISNMSLLHKVAEVAGWGVVDISTRRMATTLQMVKLQIVEDKVCSWHKAKHKNYPFNILCAGGIVNMDSCEGDSGGPLVVPLNDKGSRKYYLAGLVSYGPTKCGKNAIPAIYTRISQYQPWLLDLIRHG